MRCANAGAGAERMIATAIEQRGLHAAVSRYSTLSATIGLTRVARRAGKYDAAIATTANAVATAANVIGSCGSIPNNIDCRYLAPAIAPPTPPAMPMKARIR